MPRSLDQPITLERVRTIIRQDTTAATTWLNRPNAVQYDSASGNLFGLERADDRIVEFTADGEFRGYFGRGGEGPGEIGNPRDFAVGTERLTVLDQGNGKLLIFDRATRAMRHEIRVDRLVRNMAAVSDTLLAVTPGPAGALFELLHIDGRSLGSFGDGSYTETDNSGLSLSHVGDGRLLILKPSIPEGRLYQLDGSLIAEITFAELEPVLAAWRGEFAEKVERTRLVAPDGTPIRMSAGKLWVESAGHAADGSFFLSATPEDLDNNPWELWRLDSDGRITGRFAFEETWVRASSAVSQAIYALGIRDAFGVYEYRIP